MQKPRYVNKNEKNQTEAKVFIQTKLLAPTTNIY